MVADHDAMGRMAVRHEEDVVAENRLLAVGRAEMDRRELADHGAVPDLDVADAALLVLEVLRLHADAGVRKDLAVLADGRVAVDDGALLDDRARAELHVGADAGVGADHDVLAELRAGVHDRRGMDVLGHICLLQGWMGFRRSPVPRY